jgi:hypothetical protein
MSKGVVETEYDAGKEVLDVDELVGVVQKIIGPFKQWAKNFKGSSDDREAAQYYKQQFQIALANAQTDDSYDPAVKAEIVAGYTQAIGGLDLILSDATSSCTAPLDSVGAAAGRLAVSLCSSRDNAYKGIKKVENAIFSAIYEVLKKCISTNFAAHCEDGNCGLVPKCLWNTNIGTYYLADPAFIAGFVDGAYLTVKDLFSGSINALKCANCFSPTGIGFYGGECQEVRQKTFEFFEFFRKLSTDGQLRDQVWGELKKQASEYIDQTVCVTDPLCRYNQGKLIFDVATMFIGVGEVSAALKVGLKGTQMLKVVQVIDRISDQIKFIHRSIHGLGGKFVKTATKGVVNVLMKNGQKVFKCTNGLLSEIRWKTAGSGWIPDKVLYGVDYLNAQGQKVIPLSVVFGRVSRGTDTKDF